MDIRDELRALRQSFPHATEYAVSLDMMNRFLFALTDITRYIPARNNYLTEPMVSERVGKLRLWRTPLYYCGTRLTVVL